MKNTILIDVFQVLSAKERFLVQKAVVSPFFNQKEEVVKLWQLLNEHEKLPTKEKMFTSLFGEEIYNVQKIYTTMSHLLALIEKVLVYQHQQEDVVQQKVDLAKCYRKKELKKQFLSTINEAKVLQTKIGRKDNVFFKQAYEMELENYGYHISDRTTALQLQPMSDILDTGFVIEKLKQTCIFLSHQSVYNAQYETGLLKSVLEILEEKKEYLEIPSIATYYYCYLIFAKPSETAYFEKFKHLLFEHFALFNENDIRDLYLSAINYCIKKHNARQDEYALQGLKLYKKALKEGFLLENNVISRFSYRNIIAWSLLEKEYEWTEKFIHEYRNRLERTYRDSMFSFSLARLEYSRKNYEAALLLLQKAEYRDILLALAAKTILMKIFYETAEYDVLEAHLSSMRAYLKRKRVLGYHKTNYQNIINCTQKLIYIGNDKEKIKNIREKIEQEQILTEREWLLEQL